MKPTTVMTKPDQFGTTVYSAGEWEGHIDTQGGFCELFSDDNGCIDLGFDSIHDAIAVLNALAQQIDKTTRALPDAPEYCGIMAVSGIGVFEENETPVIPSEAALARIEKMEGTDVVCRRCGASRNFDGAMFTTMRGGNICDDCF